MRTIFYYNGTKVAKKSLVDMYGKDRIDGYVASAKQQFMEDPYVENSFFVGSGVITIEFKF